MDDTDEAILDAALDFAHDQIDPSDGYPFDVARPIANVILICWAQSHIGNGGLVYFFEMTAPGQPAYSVFCDVYREIGAHVTADCIEAAVEQFPFEDPHLDADLRRETMYNSVDEDGVPTGVFSELNDKIFADGVWDKLTRYIKCHRSTFLG